MFAGAPISMGTLVIKIILVLFRIAKWYVWHLEKFICDVNLFHTTGEGETDNDTTLPLCVYCVPILLNIYIFKGTFVTSIVMQTKNNQKILLDPLVFVEPRYSAYWIIRPSTQLSCIIFTWRRGQGQLPKCSAFLIHFKLKHDGKCPRMRISLGPHITQ